MGPEELEEGCGIYMCVNNMNIYIYICIHTCILCMYVYIYIYICLNGLREDVLPNYSDP